MVVVAGAGVVVGDASASALVCPSLPSTHGETTGDAVSTTNPATTATKRETSSPVFARERRGLRGGSLGEGGPAQVGVPEERQGQRLARPREAQRDHAPRDDPATSVVDGPQSAVFPQAHNRLHAFRGLLRFLLEEER